MKVVSSSRERTELERFALWFHQDWRLCFSDIHEGARIYVMGLPANRRAVLRRELLRFLREHTGEPPQALRRLWLKLGAQEWPRGVDVRSILNAFAEMLEEGE